jgi:hypothetical protein
MPAVAAQMADAANTAGLAVAVGTVTAEDVVIWVANLCVCNIGCVIDGTRDDTDISGDSSGNSFCGTCDGY